MVAQVDEIRERFIRWLGLLFAPTAIALAVVIFTNLVLNLPIPWWLILITAIFIIISIFLYFVGYGNSFEKIIKSIALNERSKRFAIPHILILNGTIEGSPQESPPQTYHTDRNPTDWKSAFEKLGWEVEIGPIIRLHHSHKPDFVLNPFGEVYPEVDFNSNSTGISIRDYVWSGGIYVNVAGIPFWYRHNPRTAVTETAGRIERVAEGNLIWKTFFNDLFPTLQFSNAPSTEKECMQTIDDINRFGDIVNEGGRSTLGVFRAFPLRTGLIFPILRDF